MRDASSLSFLAWVTISAMSQSLQLSSVRPFGGFQNAPSTSFASTSRGKPAAPRPAALDLPALQGASRVVQEVLIKDAQIVPDLGELLTIRMLLDLI